MSRRSDEENKVSADLRLRHRQRYGGREKTPEEKDEEVGQGRIP